MSATEIIKPEVVKGMKNKCTKIYADLNEDCVMTIVLHTKAGNPYAYYDEECTIGIPADEMYDLCKKGAIVHSSIYKSYGKIISFGIEDGIAYATFVDSVDTVGSVGIRCESIYSAEF